MITITDNTLCCGCHACANVCPKNCIRMEPDEEGFLYPRVDIQQCVSCSLCEQVCPMKDTVQEIGGIPTAYAAINRCDIIRQQSSSGGVFSALAEYVVENGGVVFGAAFDSTFRVVHMPATDKDGIAKLRGSKYVQSQIGDSYKQAKTYLETGKIVYFSGTPCQVSGLLKYLKKDYTNLITQDVVCHGVPSPEVWQKYMDFQTQRFDAPIKGVSFRTKIAGRDGYFITMEFENGRVYEVPAYEDMYMRAFTSNYSLRPSCYSCKHKGVNRTCDITLADYWGVEKVHPDLDDRRGVSFVWVNTEKGKRIFAQLAEQLRYCVTNTQTAIQYNPCAVKSVKKPPQRDVFMKDLDAANFAGVVGHYCNVSLFARIKEKIKQLLNALFK